MQHVGWLFDWTGWQYWLVFCFLFSTSATWIAKSSQPTQARHRASWQENEQTLLQAAKQLLSVSFLLILLLLPYTCLICVFCAHCCRSMRYGRLWYLLDCLAVLQAVWLSSSSLICLVVALRLSAPNNIMTTTSATTTSCPRLYWCLQCHCSMNAKYHATALIV